MQYTQHSQIQAQGPAARPPLWAHGSQTHKRSAHRAGRRPPGFAAREDILQPCPLLQLQLAHLVRNATLAAPPAARLLDAWKQKRR